MKAVTVPALVVAGLFTLMPLFGGAASFAPIFFAAAFAAAWIVILGFALVVGLPLTMLLVRLGIERAPLYVAVGFLVGIVFWFVLISQQHSDVGSAVFMGGFPGALCGWLWWRHARRDRAIKRAQS